MKKRLLLLLVLTAICLASCNKKEVDTVENPDVTSKVEVTKEATPTNVPDERIVEDAISGVMDRLSSYLEKDTKAEESTAISFTADAVLPESLTGSINNMSLKTDCYYRADLGLKTDILVHVNKQEILEASAYVNDLSELIIEAPKYTDKVLSIPIEVGEDVGISFDTSKVDSQKVKEFVPVLKKNVINSLKFKGVEKNVSIGQLDKSVSGTGYVCAVSTKKLIEGFMESLQVLKDAGIPISIDSVEDIPETEMELIYVKDRDSWAIKLISPAGDETVELISCDDGALLYLYHVDEDVCEEIFRYDVTGDDYGIFYVYLDGEEISGNVHKISNKHIEIKDLLVGNTGIVIDVITVKDGTFSVTFKEGYDEEFFKINATLSEDRGDISVEAKTGGETLKVIAGYYPTEFKPFEIPVVNEYDDEVFLTEVLSNNGRLLELIIGEEETEEEYYEGTPDAVG